MTKFLIASCLFVATLCLQLASAEELTLGSKAPKLELKEFIKGEPVTEFEKGKIYVVELWATWCGPCRATIPHLTELQKKFEDVTFIGVAVLEQDQSEVAAFVEEMGKKMDYRVALDQVPKDGEPSDGFVVKNWMEPAEQSGIPAAFIVNGESKIAWIGHPAAMEEPLAQIVEGKWDIVEEAKKLAEAKELQKKLQGIMNGLQKLYVQFNNDGKPDELLAAIDEAVKELPERATGLKLLQLQVLSTSKDRVDDAIAMVEQFTKADDTGDDPNILNNLAWILVNPDRETKADPKLLKLALTVARKADDLAKGEDPSVVDTLAKAYFDNGDLEKAVETQSRLVEMVQGTPMAADPSLKRRLNQYKKALTNSKTKTDEKETPKSKK